MRKVVTDLYSLTMKIEGKVQDFKDTYGGIFKKISEELRMPGVVEPVQVILEGIVGFCQMSILKKPETPSYLMRDFVLRLNEALCEEFGMGSVIIHNKKVVIDADNVPVSMRVNMDDLRAVIKKAIEDKLFDEKYKKERKHRKNEEDEFNRMAEKADLYASRKLNAACIAMVRDTSEEQESVDSEAILDIRYEIEKEGQLVLLI